jgi:hypothetical protein
MLMRAKTHRRILGEAAHDHQKQLNGCRADLATRDARIREYVKLESNPEAIARWTSPDGKRVLNDLQSALRLIQEYQRSLSVVLAADPHYREADALLEQWGMKGDPAKVVAGFQNIQTPPSVIEVNERGKAVSSRRDVVTGACEPIVRAHVGNEEEIEKRTQGDAALYGDQAYGQETATLVAERTPEGDRLYFVRKDEQVPEDVQAARATTACAPGSGQVEVDDSPK